MLNNFYPLPPAPSTPPPLPCIKIFKKELKHYPGANLSTRLIISIQYGFDIGYDSPEFVNTASNLKSALEFPAIVLENIISELKENLMTGPSVEPPFRNFHISQSG